MPVHVLILFLSFGVCFAALGFFMFSFFSMQRMLAEKQTTEGLLQTSEERLAKIVDNTMTLVSVKDLDGRYELVNRAFENALGVTRVEAFGKTDEDLFDSDVSAAWGEKERQVVNGAERVEFAETLKVAGGVRTYVTVKFPLRDVMGRPYAVCTISTDITDRERVERERTRLFYISLDVMTTATVDGRLRLVNPAYENTFGWKEEEVTGTRIVDLVHPDDREKTAAEFNKLSRGMPSINFECRCLAKDGSYRWMAWRVMPAPEEGIVYGVARDLTDRDHLFRTFVEHIPHVVWMEDAADRRTLYVSPAYEQVWGRTCQSLEENSHGWMDAIHADDRVRVEQAWEREFAAGTFAEDYRIVRPDGSIRWIRDRGVPIHNEKGEIWRMIGIAEDITAQREADEQLRHAERLASIGTLAAGIAHELNDPVGSLLLAAQTALNAHDDAGIRDHALQDVISEAKRCADVVDGVLKFTRHESRDKLPKDINRVVDQASGLVSKYAQEHGTVIHLSLGSDLALVPLAETEIEQVVVNLVRNAVEAGARHVTLHTEQLGDTVRIGVDDDGPGISDEARGHVFEPFYTTRESEGGTGLGLSICHGIVSEHSGTIAFETEPGKGTRIRIDLPAMTGKQREGERNEQGSRR